MISYGALLRPESRLGTDLWGLYYGTASTGQDSHLTCAPLELLARGGLAGGLASKCTFQIPESPLHSLNCLVI